MVGRTSLFFTWVAQSDCLAGQLMNDCWQIHVRGKHHGHVCLQHLAKHLGSSKENFPRAGVIVMFIELAADTKKTHFLHISLNRDEKFFFVWIIKYWNSKFDRPSTPGFTDRTQLWPVQTWGSWGPCPPFPRAGLAGPSQTRAPVPSAAAVFLDDVTQLLWRWSWSCHQDH